MIDVFRTLLDWLPGGLKLCVIAVLVIYLLPVFVQLISMLFNLIKGVVSLFLR